MARWVIYSLYTELYFSFFVRNKSIQVLYIRDTAKITINSSQYYCKIKMLITSSLFKMPIIMMAAQERLLICNVSYKYYFFHKLHFFYKKGARIFVNDNFFHCFFWRNTILEIIIAIFRLIVINHVKWMTSYWDKITIHICRDLIIIFIFLSGTVCTTRAVSWRCGRVLGSAGWICRTARRVLWTRWGIAWWCRAVLWAWWAKNRIHESLGPTIDH